MKPEEVPADLAQQAEAAWKASGHVFPDRAVRAILAAVLPEHEKQVRAKVAEAIADVSEAADDEDPEYVGAYWDGRDDGARIARGEL